MRIRFECGLDARICGNIQGNSGEKFNILGGDSIGHCEKKKVHMNTCLIPNGYPDRAVGDYKYKSIVSGSK